jgi:hypothetical protein
MLSFNNLGNLGRLGNQMFQFAALKGVARNRGLEFVIPPREVFGRYDQNVKSSDTNVYDLFFLDKKNKIGLVEQQVFQERFFHFDESFYYNCPDNTDLYGYFQSPKYFSAIEDEIKEDFKIPESIMQDCDNFFKTTFDSEVISLHIRRGDYLKYEQHPIQSLDYYQSALSQLPSNLPVIIFSSDVEWCRQQEMFEPDRFFISENNATEFDLGLMTLCSYHIIANSSFSWWGSWLSESKKTIAPKNWFAGGYSHYDVSDLFLKDWLVL